MHLKKVFCSLISACVIFASLGGGAGAFSMSDLIRSKYSSSSLGTVVWPYAEKLLMFIDGENKRLHSAGHYTLENGRRADSLAFGLFCYFCFKTKLTIYIDNFICDRVAEFNEDRDVIQDIIPGNFESLRTRFEELFDDAESIGMTEQDVIRLRPKLVRYIDAHKPKAREISDEPLSVVDSNCTSGSSKSHFGKAKGLSSFNSCRDQKRSGIGYGSDDY